MPGELLSKKVFNGEFGSKSTIKEAKKNATRIPFLLASLRDFNIPTNSWEQAAQDLTNCRCLNKKWTTQKRNRNSVTKNRQQNSALKQSVMNCSGGGGGGGG